MTTISRACPRLPNDLIIEILLRSPVKALLRFKSICKAWNAIVTSSSFQYQHFGRETNSVDLIVCWTGYVVIKDDHDVYYPMPKTVSSISIFPDGILESNPMELRGGLSEGVVSCLYGPCNGILCVSFSDCTYALWNPATRKRWPIPEIPSVTDVSDAIISFWIDPLTNEFKIFWITDEYNEMKRVRRPYNFTTYSSRNDSWTHIEPPVHGEEHVNLSQCRYSVTNGFFYFLKLKSSTRKYTVIAYDIPNELFQEIQLPEIEIGPSLFPTLDLYGDALALFIYDAGEEPIRVEIRRTEIWVMKERGCWIKLFNVGIHHLCQAFGFWKGDEFFVSRYTDEFLMSIEMMICDPVSGKTRKFEVEKIDGARYMDTIPLCYKESLISVKTFDMQ